MASRALTVAVQQAVTEAPMPLKALARRAGVSHTLLQYVVAGARSVTPALAGKVADALEAVEHQAGRLAKPIRRALASRTGSSPRGKQRPASGSR
jgi:hypothetical protein